MTWIVPLTCLNKLKLPHLDRLIFVSRRKVAPLLKQETVDCEANTSQLGILKKYFFKIGISFENSGIFSKLTVKG